MVAILKNLDRTARGREYISRAPVGPGHARLAGGHIDDLAASGKAILLTPHAAMKFNFKAYGYAPDPKLPRVSGNCDATGEFTNHGVLFLKRGKLT